MEKWINADAVNAALDRIREEVWLHIDKERKRLDDAADVAPVRHGQWEPYVECLRWRCSECGSFIDIDPIDEIIGKSLPNFCPQCGAKMDGESDG